jgi:hypothetical protein
MVEIVLFFTKMGTLNARTILQEPIMKVLLDIPDKKAAALLDVLQHISYVKAMPLTEEKSKLLQELREAVHEVKQIKTGKKESRNIHAFLREN